MKKYLLVALFVMSLFIPQAHAQWVVTDPGNSTGNTTNSTKGIATTSEMVKNMLSGFKEVEKLCNNIKRYYDAFKQVNSLIDGAYKVKRRTLMVGNISEVYVTSYKRTLADPNFCPTELAAMVASCVRLLELSGESLRELKSVTKSKVLSMNDSEHMQMIDRIYTILREYRSIVSYHTRKNISVSRVYAHEKNDLASVKALYGDPESRYW